MRLHRLVITGVGPFRDRQVIDFDELAESGLFLIDGATGSGKTTIIDSIVYALFGVVSGGSDSDPARIRSTYCTDDDPTGVECEFSVNDRRHRITRVPAGARDPDEPGRAATSKGARQTLVEFAADGSEVLRLVRSRDVAEHVESLLRMNAEQFAQLVVLPQGQFAELLRMTPAARLDSLASLLGDEFFRLVQQDLKEQGDKALRARTAAREAVQGASQRLEGRLRGHLDATAHADFTDAAVSDDERLHAVETLMDALSTQTKDADRRRVEHALDTDARREVARKAESVAGALRAMEAAREAVAEVEVALDAKDAGLDVQGTVVRLAELNVLLGSLGAHAEWERQSDRRAGERSELDERESRNRALAASRREAKQALPSEREELEARRSAAQALAATLPGATQEERRLSGLAEKAAEASRLAPVRAELEANVAAAERAQVAADTAVVAANGEVIALVTRQLEEQAAALAATLHDGGECPVCGATEHPHPATPAEDRALVTDLQVSAAQQTETRARQSAATAAATATRLRLESLELSRAGDVLMGALDGQTEEALDALLAVARASHAAAQEAAEALPGLIAEIAEVSRREDVLAAEIANFDVAAADAHAALAEREAAEIERTAQIRAAIGTAESAASLLAHTSSRITSLTALQQAQVALDKAAASVPPEKVLLSTAEADAEAAVAASALAAATELLGELTDRAAGLDGAVADATPLATEFAAALRARRSVDEQTAGAVSLAALVTAKNAKNLPLRSYALQRRFEAVLAAATVHLERMSSGKFSFELNEQVAAGHAGLGILLRDAWTGHTQEPKSLSGGETFYASLSLALGLADVVRAEGAGSELETLFIDEGFGSLDQDTLYQVLEQLDKLRAGRRAVGVVSHVTEMKEQIPDRIEVRRQADSTSTVSRARP